MSSLFPLPQHVAQDQSSILSLYVSNTSIFLRFIYFSFLFSTIRAVSETVTHLIYKLYQ